MAAYICATKAKERISILTGAGMKVCTLTGRSDSDYEFEAEMGEAVVGSEIMVKLSAGDMQGIPVSMGNPHFVSFVKEFGPGWQARAAEIQRDSHFSKGVNVEFVRLDNKREVSVLFFERGAGETQSSGTGSCASAVAAMATGRADSPVKVHAPGGTQVVRLDGRDLLRGPAKLVCRGEFFLT